MKVFISWSGSLSGLVAVELSGWLRYCIQAIRPFVSSQDIPLGSQWITQISGQLQSSSVGILCVVPGNVAAPWLNFEAGALANAMGESRVIPVLFGGVGFSDLNQSPLGQFHATVCDQDGMRKLLRDLNGLMGDAAIGDDIIASVFLSTWPTFIRNSGEIISGENASDSDQ